ncbi:MAG TPA: hypothetical protein ENH10_10480, partial [Bacteroidetes bacterium]|nr:hypothetical protein [Bacteroidota bacterium]HEX05558.1 hypothetical protein [Bacteroidota bacterium]
MTFRFRLILALLIAGLLPLIPLFISVRSAIQTGAESLAPEETGLAIQSGMELVRLELQEIRADLPSNLTTLIETVAPPDHSPKFIPHLLPHQSLYIYAGSTWYQWTSSNWSASSPPPEPEEKVFGQFPDLVQERMTDAMYREWVLLHELPESFRASAEQLQQAAADWAVSSEQRERLIASLTTAFEITYLGAMLFAIMAGLFVLSPLTRRIRHLTEVAES